MKTIGILTYWGVPNYGAWCQAYALNNVVRTIVDDSYEVRHINYLTKVHNDFYYLNDIRLQNSFLYSWEIIPHTDKLNEKSIGTKHFDIIITGSDAIWEYSVKEMGNDKHLIGNGLNTEKLIAYAASSGVTNRAECEKWVDDGLERYDSITVRDEHTRNFVKDAIGITPEIVVDPALLWNFKDDKNIPEPVYDNYIAVYGSKWDESFIKEAKQFAKDKGLLLISLGMVNDWCDISLKMIELRTIEWIGFFKKASYVFTSTFHGLMFGLNFNKQIKFDQVGYVVNRSETLLRQLGGNLEKFIEVKDYHRIFEMTLNYNVINERLDILRNHSMNLLREGILR